ncbi:MAG: DUF308 domain-containing protein, partial [Acidobacteriaceae bacterium]
FGILVAVLGVAAIVRAFASTVASMLFFGWMLILAGAFELVESFMVGQWAGFFLHLLAAILFLVTGVLLLKRPLIGAEAATFVMSFMFLIIGSYEVIAALWTHLPGWGWHVAGGAISALLGFTLLAQWPLSGLWTIGLFIGIDLIFAGCTWVALALDIRKA